MKMNLLAISGLLIANGTLAAPAQPQAKPDPIALKAAPLISRLESAIAAKDRFVALDMLTELGTLISNDTRLVTWRKSVDNLPGPKMNVAVDLGGGVKMEFVLVRSGSFTMGAERPAEAKPAHTVTFVKPFYMGKYEVTQEQWDRMMTNNPSTFQGPKNPVEQVNWNDCQSFITNLNEKVSGRKFRLPTEAEWEYACRAGNSNDYCFGSSESLLSEYAWHLGNASNMLHQVGEKKPNAWGLYDMHGNVWEWCEDRFHPTYEGAPTDGSAWIEGGETNRVARGGSWYSETYVLRSAYRGRPTPNYRGVVYGLRVVMETP
jgi:formylglycine-generating enzyme required for sulfatase activity